jgi:hypothetical protein
MNAIRKITAACVVVVILILACVPGKGLAQARLIINGAQITIIDSAFLVIDNSSSDAITRLSGGYIVSEGADNNIKWVIGPSPQAYVVPFGYNGDYIPVTFSVASSSTDGYFLLSTYHTTSWNNSASLPASITNFIDVLDNDQSALAVDRFWKIDAEGYSSMPSLTNLSFVYRDAEHNSVGNTITESGLRAIRWNSNVGSWGDSRPSSSINTSTNTVTVNNVSAVDFYPWWTLSFAGIRKYWASASSGSWSNGASWSTTPNGIPGTDVPSSRDIVVFDGSKDGACTINGNVTIGALDIQSGYSGIISQTTRTVSIVKGGNFSGGTYRAGTARLEIGGDFFLGGTTFVSTTDTLDVKGNIVLSAGTFDHNAGTLKLSGTAPQSVSGGLTTNFNDITVTNTAVSIESNQNLLGVLTLAENVKLDTDGTGDSGVLTLISNEDDPTDDAAIALLPPGAEVTGQITVERFMAIEGANNGRIYRYISSPLSDATVSDIQQEIPVTGSFTGASNCSGCSGQSMFEYKEQIINDINGSGVSDLNDGFVDFPQSTNAELLQPGRGYAVFVRGNLLSSALWDVRGRINAANFLPITLPTAYTSSGSLADDGWNLVGNPFPAAIDWNGTGWTKNNLESSIYIRDNGTSAGQFATWNGVVGTNGGSRYIAMGQAFWIKADGSGMPLLQVNELVKSPRESTTFFRDDPPKNVMRIFVSAQGIVDEAVIHFRSDATRAFDQHADARKLLSSSFNLGSLSDDEVLLSINSRPTTSCVDTIPLGINNLQMGTYTMRFDGLETFEQPYTFEIYDSYTHTAKPLVTDRGFDFVVDSDPLSAVLTRFRIIANKDLQTALIEREGDTLRVDVDGAIQWYINDVMIEGANSHEVLITSPGAYRVQINHEDCIITGSIDITITGIEPENPAMIKVFPNPVKNMLTIELISANQVMDIDLVNTVGQVCYRINANTSSNIDVSQLSPGIYLLKISTAARTYFLKVVKE